MLSLLVKVVHLKIEVESLRWGDKSNDSTKTNAQPSTRYRIFCKLQNRNHGARSTAYSSSQEGIQPSQTDENHRVPRGRTNAQGSGRKRRHTCWIHSRDSKPLQEANERQELTALWSTAAVRGA